jgi:hypothetical protein
MDVRRLMVNTGEFSKRTVENRKIAENWEEGQTRQTKMEKGAK